MPTGCVGFADFKEKIEKLPGGNLLGFWGVTGILLELRKSDFVKGLHK